ncbi:MAG: helix-turn-helix transcriptional regulator [Verrucomicrobia bacterium]|nr:helix-turn-helix transcriptional regulator [Verrucomicrobiota bacterium]
MTTAARHETRDVHRPTAQPSVALPFGARSVGHYRLQPGFRSVVRVIHFVQVFWGLRGAGAVMVNGVERRLGTGEVALYLPGMEHRLYSLNAPWEYWWWTMDGPLAAANATATGLNCARIYKPGPPPVGLFMKLVTAIQNVTPAGERRASALAYELLTRAAGRCANPSLGEAIQTALDLIHREWSHPALCVKTMAQQLRLHRSSFSRRFHAAMGIAPADYLANLRMQNALSRLRSAHLSIAETARVCGWRDPDYFCRCVRRATGLAPRQFRRQ